MLCQSSDVGGGLHVSEIKVEFIHEEPVVLTLMRCNLVATNTQATGMLLPGSLYPLVTYFQALSSLITYVYWYKRCKHTVALSTNTYFDPFLNCLSSLGSGSREANMAAAIAMPEIG